MKSLHCIVHPSMPVGFADDGTAFSSGCTIFSVTFPKTAYVEVDEIHFRNYYVAYLTILARKHGSGKAEDRREWRACLRSKQLMPLPHCEQGSEDYFVIRAQDCLFPLTNIVELRFVLRQPSPVWKEFKVEELQLFKAVAGGGSKDVSLPAWISELGSAKEEDGDRQLKGVTSVVELSKQVQQLWALTEQANTSQTSACLGRYDIDGCYDINLLSYN